MNNHLPTWRSPSSLAVFGAIWLSFGGLLLLGGCANSGGTATAVAATEIGLTGTEKAATLYVSLPQCGATHPKPFCSEADVIAKIKQADNTAYAAVMAARAGGDDAKVAAANAAIAALVSLIPAATGH